MEGDMTYLQDASDLVYQAFCHFWMAARNDNAGKRDVMREQLRLAGQALLRASTFLRGLDSACTKIPTELMDAAEAEIRVVAEVKGKRK
jgi:hypothetical protein